MPLHCEPHTNKLAQQKINFGTMKLRPWITIRFELSPYRSRILAENQPGNTSFGDRRSMSAFSEIAPGYSAWVSDRIGSALLPCEAAATTC